MTTSSSTFTRTLTIDRAVVASWILGVGLWAVIVGGFRSCTDEDRIARLDPDGMPAAPGAGKGGLKGPTGADSLDRH